MLQPKLQRDDDDPVIGVPMWAIVHENKLFLTFENYYSAIGWLDCVSEKNRNEYTLAIIVVNIINLPPEDYDL